MKSTLKYASRCLLPVFLLLFGSTGAVVAQAPGLIYKPATGNGSAVLDPNGDGFVSGNSDGFETSDVAESEIPFHGLPQLATEPVDDVRTGPGGGHTDLADNGEEQTAFMFYDGENIIFRIRLAGQSTASKGYSFFFNTDFELFGPKGGNFSSVNPGFQFEVVLETNNRVSIYELGGEGGEEATLRTSLDIDQHHQRAISYTHVGGGTGYFYDFYIPASAIEEAIDGFTFDESTEFRAAVATITRAQSGIVGTISDINGVNDGNYRNRVQALIEMVEASPSVTLNDLAEGGDGFKATVEKTNPPTVSQPIFADATSVMGSLNEADGGTVRVYKNGEFIGSVSDVENFSWTLAGIDALAEGDVITARAQVGAKELSAFSAEVTVLGSSADVCPNGITAAPVITGEAQNNRGFEGTAPAGSKVRVYNSTGELQMAQISSNPDEYQDYVIADGDGTWTFRWCQTGNHCVPAGSYFATAEDETANQCESALSDPVSADETGTTAVPEILSTPAQGDTKIEVKNLHDAAAVLHLYINGNLVASSPDEVATNETFTFSSLNIFDGDTVESRAKEPGAEISEAASVTVSAVDLEESTPPDITGNYTDTSTLIQGYTAEGGGTTIRVYQNGTETGNVVGTTTADSSGDWDLAVDGFTLSAGDELRATAEAPEKSESDFSTTVVVLSGQSAVPEVNDNLTIDSNEIVVTIDQPGLVTIYVDDSPIGELTFASSGTHLIQSNDFDEVDNDPDFIRNELYQGGAVTATLTEADKPESDHSAPVYVVGVESFRIELVNADDKFAGEEFDIVITAVDGPDGTGNTFQDFEGTVTLFSDQVPITDGYRVTGSFTQGSITHTIMVNDGHLEAELEAIDTGNPEVSGISDPFTINNPQVIVLNAISPEFKYRGEAGFELTLTGSGFVSSSEVRFAGDERVTTFVSTTELRATILPSDLDATGDFELTVFNPPPLGTGEETAAVDFEVRDPPAPDLTTLSPNAGERFSSLNVTFSGSGLIENVTEIDFGDDIQVNSISGNANYDELVANISIAGGAAIGERTVTVTNSSPGGGSDNLAFTVNDVPHAGFAFETVGDQNAGGEFDVTVSAVEADGSTVVPEFAGSVILTVSGEGEAVVVDGNEFTDGVATITLYVTKSGTDLQLSAVNAEEGSNQEGASNLFNVSAGTPGAYLVSVDNQTPIVNGTVEVSAQLVDDWDNPVAEQGRQVAWSEFGDGGGSFAASETSTDTQGIAEVVFTAPSEAGMSNRVYAEDGSGLSGVSPVITSQPVPEPDHFTLSGPAEATAGEASGTFTLTVRDENGDPVNVDGDTSFALSSTSGGTFSFSGGATVTVSDGASSVTFTYTDTEAAAQTVEAAFGSGDTRLDSQEATHEITIVPAVLDRLVLTLPGQTFTAGEGNLGDPDGVNAATAFSITIRATDSFFNVISSYAGEKTLDFSGPSSSANGDDPVYPGTVTFENGEAAGENAASVTLVHAETVQITAEESDGGTPVVSGTSSELTVNAGAASQLVIVQQPSGGTGNADGEPVGIGTVQLETRDQYGNASTVGLDATQEVTVTLSVDSSGEGDATLGGIETLDIQNGSVSFENLTLDRNGEGFRLEFTSSSPVDLGSVQSDAFDMTDVEAEELKIVKAELDRDESDNRRLTYWAETEIPEGAVVPSYSTDFDQWQSLVVADIVSLGEDNGLQKYEVIFPGVETDVFIATFEVDWPAPVELPQALAEVWMSVEGLEGRRAYNFLSVPVQRPSVYEGVVQTTSGSEITPESAGWDEGAFAAEDGWPAFYLEVTSGASEGVAADVAGSTSNAIQLADGVDASSLLSPADTFVIRSHWTLDSLLGASNEAGLRGGSVQSLADEVTFYDPVTGVDHVYWYSNHEGYEGWRDKDYGSAGNVVLHPDQGFIVIRTIPEQVKFSVIGQVKATPSRVSVVPGYNLLPAPFPRGTSLNESELRQSGLEENEVQEEADEVLLLDLPGAIQSFYYRSGTGYVDSASPDVEKGDEVVITPGRAFFINRKPESPFTWVLAEPAVPQP